MLDKRSKFLRRLIIEQVKTSRRGHIGSALSIVEILRVLYDDFMSYNVSDLSWAGRDRFILSKGHGCMALYAILAEKGFFSKAELPEMSLDRAVAVVRVVQPHLGAWLRTQRVKGRRHVRVGPARRFEVIAEVGREGVALR